MPITSASALKRVKACMASALLPSIETKNESADKGNAIHEFLAKVVVGGVPVEEAIRGVAEEYKADCLAINLDSIPQLHAARAEVAYAFDVTTGTARELGAGLNRDYSGARPTEIVGTCDRIGWTAVQVYLDAHGQMGERVHGVRNSSPEQDNQGPGADDPGGDSQDSQPEGGREGAQGEGGEGKEGVGPAAGRGVLRVDDYKTGFASHVEPARENLQLLFLAVCAAQVEKQDEVEVAIVRTLEGVRDDNARLDAIDLQAGRLMLMDLGRRLLEFRKSGRVPTPVEGPHCGFCGSFNFCSAKSSLIRQLVDKPNLTADSLLEMLTPEDADKAYAKYREIRKVLDKLNVAFRKYAEHRPIKTVDGKTWGPVETRSTVLDPQIVQKVMREMHGIETADDAFAIETSKTAIRRALSKIAPKGQLAAMEREVLKKIHEAGGIKLETSVRFEEK